MTFAAQRIMDRLEGRYDWYLTLAPGAPVMLLDPDDVALAGDVSAAITAGEAPF